MFSTLLLIILFNIRVGLCIIAKTDDVLWVPVISPNISSVLHIVFPGMA